MLFRAPYPAEEGVRTSQPTLKAVIFDLDGVAAHSHAMYEIAWRTLLVDEGLDGAALHLDFLYAGHPKRTIPARDEEPAAGERV